MVEKSSSVLVYFDRLERAELRDHAQPHPIIVNYIIHWCRQLDLIGYKHAANSCFLCFSYVIPTDNRFYICKIDVIPTDNSLMRAECRIDVN